jgi:signal recognition particle subunit SRP54
MAGRILGMGDVVGLVETAASKISEQEAQASFEKMVLGDFTLEDMLEQLRMIKRWALEEGARDDAGHGATRRPRQARRRQDVRAHGGAVHVDDAQERLRPDVIDMSRRRRIARGAGQDPNAVGELLKSFQGMKRMMKEMNRMGLGAKIGAKAKQDSLRAMSPTGELAAQGLRRRFVRGLGGAWAGSAGWEACSAGPRWRHAGLGMGAPLRGPRNADHVAPDGQLADTQERVPSARRTSARSVADSGRALAWRLPPGQRAP